MNAQKGKLVYGVHQVEEKTWNSYGSMLVVMYSYDISQLDFSSEQNIYIPFSTKHSKASAPQIAAACSCHPQPRWLWHFSCDSVLDPPW